MKLEKNIMCVLGALLFLFTSCGLDENPVYDLKFIHIMVNESSTVTVSSKANMIGTYNVYLSAPASNETVTVTYEVIVGDGLKEGVDYKWMNKDNTLTFLPGIYDMPIRIQWIVNPVDPSKDNTIKIKLISNDKGYTIGLPGPAQNQSELTITKA
ncbi:hypothetical protein [uncultured Proteiniphilum sp.]|uniref:hypothetical protein n=1 Tax=uncultured Proteiniphilum sp. TaxID=497637 RepID=UPI002638D38C|nr:hypothetical protein [uncultured Proteiniphilum sp.]